MKRFSLLIFGFLFTSILLAQKKADTVVIKVGQGSKIIFAIQDKNDLETMKKYNFQKLMDDMIYKLEVRDSTKLAKTSTDFLKDSVKQTASVPEPESVTTIENRKKHYGRRTRSSFNIDIGTNNYLENGKFPDASNSLYAVRPWGSWYVGLNVIERTRVAGKFFLEWGGGISWYNFKFQNDRVQMSKDDQGVYFNVDSRAYNFSKSKLTATFLNVSLVPMLDFGRNKYKPAFFDGHHASGFRIGVGPYAGYRIDSYTKQVYDKDGSKEREHHHDAYYLNNLRYGMRLQLGFNDVDFFFNYDMNNLFVDGKGPQVNAFSFGITL
jgi:hypothetical protein